MESMKRLLSIGIILLFIGMSLSSSTGLDVLEQPYTAMSNSKTLYVGGSGPGNYSTIQAAIDFASAGDTIFVYNGTYFIYSDYKLVIDKSIILIGEEKNTTIIEGYRKDHVIIITSDSVTITGFTIIKSGREHNDAGISVTSSFNEIFGNIFENNSLGIKLSGISYYSKVYNNIFRNNSFRGITMGGSLNSIYENFFTHNNDGILLHKATNNNITNNTFFDNGDGVFLYHDAELNLIKNNIFISNSQGVYVFDASDNYIYSNNLNLNTIGIEIHGHYGGRNNKILKNIISKNLIGIHSFTEGNVIDENKIYDNEIYAIIQKLPGNNYILNNDIKNSDMLIVEGNDSFISENIIENGGIILVESVQITITNNNFISSKGITITGHKLNQWNTHTIENNNIDEKPICYYKNIKTGQVQSIAAQVILANCKNFDINNLTIDSVTHGVQLGFSSNNIISGNIIENSYENGITLYYSSRNTITNNIITNNCGDGIYIKTGLANNIFSNTISENENGIYLSTCIFNIIGRNNFLNNSDYHAFFYTKKPLQRNNIWIRNYWDNRIGFLPMLIIGEMRTPFSHPYNGDKRYIFRQGLNFDWFPAQESYDIEV